MLRAPCFLLLLLTPVLHAQAEKPAAARKGYIEADVRFMQQMIGHHGQAIRMAAMVQARTGNAELRLLAERIDVSQRDEIASMGRWLRVRGESVPDASAHVHELMPGMLNEDELASLAGTQGPAFDRLFLAAMIRHHEGALVMVERLFATAGAAQEPELAGFANDVDADQRAEIRRMRAMLENIS